MHLMVTQETYFSVRISNVRLSQFNFNFESLQIIKCQTRLRLLYCILIIPASVSEIETVREMLLLIGFVIESIC